MQNQTWLILMCISQYTVGYRKVKNWLWRIFCKNITMEEDMTLCIHCEASLSVPYTTINVLLQYTPEYLYRVIWKSLHCSTFFTVIYIWLHMNSRKLLSLQWIRNTYYNASNLYWMNKEHQYCIDYILYYKVVVKGSFWYAALFWGLVICPVFRLLFDES